jgi:DNA invertase Pin-like site-specific DNA recombinase
MIYGYARVSTDSQSVEAQVRQLTKAGCKKVFREIASGAKTDRAQLRKALDQLESGNLLMVTRLDRLARSTRDLLNTLAAITDKNAGFRSLGDAGLSHIRKQLEEEWPIPSCEVHLTGDGAWQRVRTQDVQRHASNDG